MKKSYLLGTVCAGLLISIASAQASVVFYSDVSAFNIATSSTTLINFEGIVPDVGVTSSTSQVLSGITFTTSAPALPAAIICGKFACNGNPFDSALYAADDGKSVVINLTTAGSGFTAAGGIFGDINGPVGGGTISVYGLSGLLDTQIVTVGDMGAELPHTFFGWTTADGDEITGIEFSIDGGQYSALDDFQYGLTSVVPVPATVWLFGSGLLGLIGLSKRKKAS